MQAIRSFLKNEKGATAIEYGLIAALIAVVIIAAVTLVGGGLDTKFKAIACKLGNAPTNYTCPA